MAKKSIGKPVVKKQATQKRRYSAEDLARIVESEGLGYAIQGYVNPEQIEDPILRAVWTNAQEAMEEIERWIEPFMD